MIFLGLGEDTWLIIALTFLGLSGVSFLWVWWVGFIRDRQSGQSIEYPWD